jgi:D-amino-acid dehydrogenase
MSHILIAGGGIIGLSSALYLRRAGWEVTVLDRQDFLDNCSYGNAGYVSPSHFVPLAAPGIVWQGLKWMADSGSPFYIQPRLDRDLIRWGWRFMRHAHAGHVARSAPFLRDLLLLSRAEYLRWQSEWGIDLALDTCGMLELFQSAAIQSHADDVVAQAAALGLNAEHLDAAAVQGLLPDLQVKALGGIRFHDDAQLYPQRLMASLLTHLRDAGVRLLPHMHAIGFETRGRQLIGLQTPQGTHRADHYLIAAGTWSQPLAATLGLRLPMQGGRGYSVTLDPSPWRFPMSVVLEEARVAISPMAGDKLRFGGTMEITRTDTPPRMQRVQRILDGVRSFFPEINVPLPPPEQVWHGYRPLSMDGLPYIGPAPGWDNLTVATGHSMLGISLGPGTGKLVAEMLNGGDLSMDIKAFRVGR